MFLEYLISSEALFLSLGIKETKGEKTCQQVKDYNSHDACMYFYNTCLPVTARRDNWSWGNYPWLPWPAEELGHDYNNSADTPLATVRKGQTESSAHPCTQRTQGHTKHLSFQNASRMPVIGVLFQLASKSQTLLTFLGNSCRKRTNIYLFRQTQASFKEQDWNTQNAHTHKKPV